MKIKLLERSLFKGWQFKAFLVACVCLISMSSIEAQTIKGIVTSNGEPLAGATVIVVGTSTGAVTDFDGNYEIKAEPGNQLQFSYLGYVDEIVTVGDQTTINVSLKEDTSTLDEVVVIGYGKQTKRKVQGAIETVKAETIEKSGTTDLGTALQGQIAGVNVTASSGQPGSNAVILIRGVNSVFGSNEPLYVVDGIVQQDNPQLSPNEIESLDIIKDAATAAVYGTRASNGVILITTKKGRVGTTSVKLNSYYGVQKIVSGVPLMDTEDILYNDIKRDHLDNPGAVFANTFNITELNRYGLTNNSDITDIVQNDLASIQSHNINLSGGREGLLFNLNGTFFDQEGTQVNSGTERFNIRANTTFEKGRFKFTSGINLVTDKTDLSPFNILLRAYAYRPYSQPVDLSGGDITNIGADSNDGASLALGQFARILRQRNFREADDFNFSLRMDFEISDDLTFVSRGNFGRRNVLQTTINPFFQILSDDGVPVVVNPVSGAFASNRRRKTFLLENYLTWNKTINDNHNLTFTGLFSAEEATTTFFSAQGLEFLNNVVTNLGGTTESPIVAGNEFSNSLLGVMFRFQYDYKGKYLFNSITRIDASSRFPEQNRNVPLPSISGAWIVSEENFWKNTFGSTFNFFKIRAGYGTVGNQFLGDYAFQPVVAIDRDYVFGDPNLETLSIGQIQDAFANANLKWERKQEANLGLEMAFFNNKLNITTDVYDGTRKDMLFNVLIPPSVGSTANNVTLNVGDMRNYGIEVGARYSHASKNGDFTFNAAATYSRNVNEITKMSATNTFQLLNFSEIARGLGGATNNDNTTTLREGYEAAAFFLYENEGVIKTEEELAEYQTRFTNEQSNIGDLKFKDQNGDNILDVNDRVYRGSGAPEFELGLNLNFAYKGLDLSMQWYGSFGNEVLNGSKAFAYRSGTHKDLLNTWTRQNPNSDLPADRGRETFSYRSFSDFWLEDGTFIRLRNIQLGYALPNKWINKIGLTRARIFVAADNPLTITDYTGFDPEAGAFEPNQNNNTNGLNRRGIDSGNYPISSQIRGGIQFNF